MARTRPAAGAVNVPALLGRLTRLRTGRHRVVSCFLKIEPRDRARGKYLIKLKNRIRKAEEGLPRLGLDRVTEAEVRADLARVEEFLRVPGNLPASRGVVVYACGPLKLFEVIAVPRVHRSRLGVDASAQVRELAALDDEVGRILAVVLDRTAARFFEVTAFGVDELPGLRADSTRGGRFRGDQDGPGWGEHAYNNRMRTERARHLDLVARRLFALDREHRATGVVVGGMGGDPAALRPFLHPYLDGRVLGEIRTNPKEATPASVREAVLDAREAHERDAERSNARQLAELLGKRMAVTGVGESLRALRRGQVRTLLVDPDASEPGWRAEATGRLALREIELRDEGELAPVLDVVDDAIEDALRQQAVVDVVYDPEARRGIDGLAAFLRFR
jgi:peptide subunit release factor 1 (eRF1)